MGLFRSTQDGIRALRDKRRRNHEIDEELESFIGESVSEKMRRGMSPENAIRAARVEAGSTEVVKHKVWNAGWESAAETLWRDLAYSLRRLSRTPGFLAVVLLSIGIGVAANATIFSLVSKFLLEPVHVGDPATLVKLSRTFEHGRCCNNFPEPIYLDIREQAQSFSGVAAYFDLVPAAIGGDGSQPDRIWGQVTSANFFDVTQLTMAAGRGFAANEEQAPIIVIGYRLWQQKFAGDPNIVGKPLDVSGHVYTVVGVAPKGFRGLDRVLDPQFWVPLGRMPELLAQTPNRQSRTLQWLNPVGRLKPGVTPEAADREMEVIAARLAEAHPGSDKDYGIKVQKLGSLGRDEAALKMFLLAISVVAFVVLLIACANVANLLLAQGSERQREMAVRLALGATRAQLLRQLLVESLLMALGGGIVGVLLALWSTWALSSFRIPHPVAMDLTVSVDWRVLLYAFLLSVAAGLVCGFVPAWTSSRPMMPNALKGEEALVRPGRRLSLRSVLVVVQITLSLILLCGSGLFLRSLERAAAMDVGFVSRGVVMMAIDPQMHQYTPERAIVMLRSIRERMTALPGVQSASITDGVPLSMGHRSDGFSVPGHPKPQGQNVVELYMAAPDYFETLGIPLLAGSPIGDENPSAPAVGVVNQEFVRRFFQGDNPIGETVDGAGVPYKIIGVVKDTKSRTIGEDQRPVLYRSINQSIAKDPSQDGYNVMVRYQGDPATLISAMQHEIHAVDPSLAVFNITTMEEHMQEALFLPRFVSSLFSIFGVAGVLLASIGLYGVMSYTVSRRTKEIGVRMALGARATQVQSMIVRGGMRLAIISLVIGLPVALATARLATSLLYGVQPWDIATFTLIPVLLIAVSLVACWIPSRRASRVDPIAALRMD